ncbi:hypothetical protein FOZ61_006571 [Perkinsus olseni]|uniref:Uncharacterized protein n=1 Tax=Perkinsus olseni TaxID=32597 RepID=A0A7J6M9R3_PEROL|nr:hypothetical protein FOZ61_006571 [Perkinsus olseni]
MDSLLFYYGGDGASYYCPSCTVGSGLGHRSTSPCRRGAVPKEHTFAEALAMYERGAGPISANGPGSRRGYMTFANPTQKAKPTIKEAATSARTSDTTASSRRPRTRSSSRTGSAPLDATSRLTRAAEAKSLPWWATAFPIDSSSPSNWDFGDATARPPPYREVDRTDPGPEVGLHIEPRPEMGVETGKCEPWLLTVLKTKRLDAALPSGGEPLEPPLNVIPTPLSDHHQRCPSRNQLTSGERFNGLHRFLLKTHLRCIVSGLLDHGLITHAEQVSLLLLLELGEDARRLSAIERAYTAYIHHEHGSFLEANPRRSGSEVLEEEEEDEEDDDDESVLELPLAMSILGVARPAPSHSAWDSGVVPDSTIESASFVESSTSTLPASPETVSLVERQQSSSSLAMTADPGAVLKLVVAWCSNIWFICLASIGAYFAYDKMYDQRRRTKSVIVSNEACFIATPPLLVSVVGSEGDTQPLEDINDTCWTGSQASLTEESNESASSVVDDCLRRLDPPAAPGKHAEHFLLTPRSETFSYSSA